MNIDYFDYFDLEDYVKKISLCDFVQEHINYTTGNLKIYLDMLTNYEDTVIENFLVRAFNKEVDFSLSFRRNKIHDVELSHDNLCIDDFTMSENRIKSLHNRFNGGMEYDYRKKDAWRGYIDPYNGKECVYWYGARPYDINNFMNHFIKIYSDDSATLLNNNLFLKSALVYLLFLRIHPFSDGNSRTARMIYQMKLTELISKQYNYNFRVSPLYISNRLFDNQLTYVKLINNIFFDMQHDCNDEINKLFDFFLNISDDQITYLIDELKTKKQFLSGMSCFAKANNNEDTKLKRTL